MIYKLISLSIVVGLIMICSMIHIVSGADPIAYYRLNEGPGYTLPNVRDYTNNGYDGYAYNVSEYSPGYIVDCLCFGVPHSYVDVEDNIIFSFTNGVEDYDFSISMWVNSNSYNNTVLCSKGHFTPDFEYTIYCGVNGNLYYYMFDSDHILHAYKYGRTDKSLSKYVDEWIHLVITHGPLNEINMFVNGNKWKIYTNIGANYTSMNDGTDNFTIGQVNSFSNEICIDELIVWNSYLTESDVSELHASYYNESHSITFMSADLFNQDVNYSLYENKEYVGTYQYGDTVSISDMSDYKIVIHETTIDQLQDIKHAPSIIKKYTTLILYGLVGVCIISLIIWIIRKW